MKAHEFDQKPQRAIEHKVKADDRAFPVRPQKAQVEHGENGELAQRFAVSRMTVRHALSILADQGRVYSVRGHGTFVAEPHVAKDATLASFTEDMQARGFVPGSRLLNAAEVPVAGAVARALELPDGAPTYCIERLRLADDVPMCLETVHLPARLFPRLLDNDLTGSLYAVMREYNASPFSADEELEATQANDQQAEILGVQPGSPLLLITRTSFTSDGVAVEFSRDYHRSDRARIRIKSRVESDSTVRDASG